MHAGSLGPVSADDSLGLLKKKIENKQTIYTSIELVSLPLNWCKCGWKFCATLQGVSGKVYRAWMGVQRSNRFYLLAKDETMWSCIFPNEKKAGKEDGSQS